MAKWIDFINQESVGKKTDTYFVQNRETRSLIGQVKWYGPFRKYSFFPLNNTVYEPTCLRDIAEFIDKLMTERKNVSPA